MSTPPARRHGGFCSILVVTAAVGASALIVPWAQAQRSSAGDAAGGSANQATLSSIAWSELTGGDLSLDLSIGGLVAAGVDAGAALPEPAAPPSVAALEPVVPDSSSMGAVIVAPMLAPPLAPDFGRTPQVAEMLAIGAADAVLEGSYRRGPESRAIEIQAGDTLLGVLSREGVASGEAHAVIAALETVYNLRRMQIGQEITLAFQHSGRDSTFLGLELMPAVDRIVRVERNGEDGFVAEETVNELMTERIYAGGAIDSSLYAATNSQGVPDSVLIRIIRAFSYDVDFQRDIQPGDRFELFYEMDYQPDGSFARSGEVLFANLTLRGRETPIYLFEGDDGSLEYYKRDGTSVRRALLRTPVDGFRVSSGYGMRRHPILGYSRMHRGIDFAAPPGTPIYAAGDGVIEMIGPNSGYGNYIRIRHNNTMSTAYAHMSRFASSLSRGSRVSQGQIIGYVGSTGMSTGPHLHYEVLINGSQVNPMSVDLPTGRELTDSERRRFLAMVDEIDADLVAWREEAGEHAPLPRLTEAQVSDASQ